MIDTPNTGANRPDNTTSHPADAAVEDWDPWGHWDPDQWDPDRWVPDECAPDDPDDPSGPRQWRLGNGMTVQETDGVFAPSTMAWLDPGGELAALMDATDPTELGGYDLMVMLRSTEKMVSWATARQHDVIRELALRRPAPNDPLLPGGPRARPIPGAPAVDGG